MLKTSIRAAVVQMAAGENKAENVEKAVRLVRRAVKKKAQLIVLPECFLYRGEGALDGGVAEKIDGPAVKTFQALAREEGVSILLGSVYEKVSGKKKVYNTSVLIDSGGKIAGTYRKMHLFEACVSGHTVCEPDIFLAGRSSEIFSLGGFLAGGAICYDLRFPEQFRFYAQKGCDLFFVPSNFTYETGRADWEVLLRARAIENRCYVLAPNQHGRGAKGLRSYGNSMIVDPRGKVVKRADAGSDEILLWTLEKKEILKARKSLP